MSRLPKAYLSVRWKLIVPFIFIIVLVLAVLLPITTGLVASQVEDQANQRLSQIADSATVLLQAQEKDVSLSAQFVANLQELQKVVISNDQSHFRAVLDPR